ncbi:MAG: (2Fe-2S)-binding protein [Oscillospiraceae bacterium]|nr:(2Fe-2S)-binding protein [Oscillospiraceae bacterium]
MTEISNELMDKLTKICLCKGISRATIKKAILNGADTVEKVWKESNSGNGGCKGKRCGSKIEELINTMKKQEENM